MISKENYDLNVYSILLHLNLIEIKIDGYNKCTFSCKLNNMSKIYVNDLVKYVLFRLC